MRPIIDPSRFSSGDNFLRVRHLLFGLAFALERAAHRANRKSELGQRINQAIGIDFIHNVLPAFLATDQSRIFQNRQMAGNGGRAHFEARSNIARREFLLGQIGQNLAARR